MINNEMFTNRLQVIFEYYKLSASAFAEKMGVGRSSISHIVSGRNKPSLDFVLHILDNFPEVSFDWLILGKGQFPNNAKDNQAPTLFENTTRKENSDDVINDNPLQTSNPEATTVDTNSEVFPKKTDAVPIERIVIFYADQSFKEYKN